MLEPNRNISEGHRTVLLKTKSGQEISGVLSAKTGKAWIITLPDGKTQSIKPDAIGSHTLASAMPPMGALMKPEEIRDVVSYLGELE